MDPDCQLVEPESQLKNQRHHQNEESTKDKKKKKAILLRIKALYDARFLKPTSVWSGNF